MFVAIMPDVMPDVLEHHAFNSDVMVKEGAWPPYQNVSLQNDNRRDNQQLMSKIMSQPDRLQNEVVPIYHSTHPKA